MALSPELAEIEAKVKVYAREYGLDFFDTIFELLDYQQINEVAAYDGFPGRYPHWRFGMEYLRMSRSYAYGLHRIYEMVINNNPSYAYLLASNKTVDQKTVMAHVYAHVDFFKNNMWFAHTNRKMMDEMANHGTHIRRYIDRYGYETVERFLDLCLSLDNLIDPHSPGIRRRVEPAPKLAKDEEDEPGVPPVKLPSKFYMDDYINPPEFLEAQRKKIQEEQEHQKHFPERPERDALLFLLEHAPLEEWQSDIISIVREEAYHFAPQGQTKIMNEGWACVVADSLLYTEEGPLRLGDMVNQQLAVRVSDGQVFRSVYDWRKFENRETIWLRTRRGLELEGSISHRLALPDGSWRRLDELHVGDLVRLGAGLNQWAKNYVPLDWQPVRRITLDDIASQVGVDIETVIRYRQGVRGRYSETLAAPVAEYDEGLTTMTVMQNKRRVIHVPIVVNERLAAFLGYLIGDGHISEVKRVIGLTTGDEEQANRFAELAHELFDVTASQRKDEGRWRVDLHSKDVEDFIKHLGLKTGRAARFKTVPEVILRSPKAVVAAFLRAYFDCDGYAGKQGVILSTSSESIGQVVQLLLLNFGILSARRPHKDGCWHIHITGQSAVTFESEIDFGLQRKRQALREYVQAHQWFKSEDWRDQVAAIERRRADVCDLSVAESHCYAAQGVINHNSYWHSKIMTERALKPDELIDYADHHAGILASSPGHLNPYKLGLELWRDIEERWDKGRFGSEWEECQDEVARRDWDRQLGLGRQKIFEVRRVYNDVGFIDAFLTPEFARRHSFFTYKYGPKTNEYVIDSRDFTAIKRQLLFSLTNFGQPIVAIQDANHANRGELYLRHQHEGIDLRLDWARDTLANVQAIWSRPVHLETLVKGTPMLFSYDGEKHSGKGL